MFYYDLEKDAIIFVCWDIDTWKDATSLWFMELYFTFSSYQMGV